MSKPTKPSTLEAMLKWASKRRNQRLHKPLAKHATETMAKAEGRKEGKA